MFIRMIAVLLPVICFASFAADEHNGKAKVDTPMEKKYDANGNGIIDPGPEAQAVRAELEKRKVDNKLEERADKNGDGIINNGEGKKLHDFIENDTNHDGKIDKHERLDRNNDGKVDDHERNMARRHAEKRNVDTPLEERFDKNNDGHIGRREANRMNNFKENDTNHDGKIDRHERIDRNNDGKVGPGERHRAKEIMQKSKVDTPWEDKADKNNNGRVERREAKHMRQNQHRR